MAAINGELYFDGYIASTHHKQYESHPPKDSYVSFLPFDIIGCIGSLVDLSSCASVHIAAADMLHEEHPQESLKIQNRMDNILKRAEIRLHNSSRIDHLVDLAKAFSISGNLVKAVHALKIAIDKTGDHYEIAKTLADLVVKNVELNNINEEELAHLNDLLPSFKKLSNKTSIKRRSILEHLIKTSISLNNLPCTLVFLREYKISIINSDIVGQLKGLNDLNKAYLLIGRLIEGVLLSKDNTFNLLTTLKEDPFLFTATSKICAQQGMVAASRDLLGKAYEISKRISIHFKVQYLVSIALAYYQINMLNKGIALLQEAEIQTRNYRSIHFKALGLTNLAKAYLQIGRVDIAMVLLQEAEDTSTVLEKQHIIRVALEEAIEIETLTPMERNQVQSILQNILNSIRVAR
ncbi:MAG: hypothetical protein COT84_08540 [Chlamydiae bacterium CG10_big_fil_rev_8_21_14_0_10_35_9]|nr:MAG: hypothetical protein COT84_08540 [Chlamydiae bacterium CG10_big_fil_rev_8_21_14_0_10_35_9]